VKKIQVRRGLVSNLPSLDDGELGWAQDTRNLYVGDGSASPVKVGSDITAFAETLLDDTNAAEVIATLGLDADLATLSVPASTTISAFGKTIVDDADETAVLATLGLTISTFAKTLLDDTTAAAFRATADAQRNIGEYNIEDYGAVGNSNAVDNKTALDATVTACPAGATIYIPPKAFWLKTAWTCDKAVNIRGSGIASQIIVATGTGAVAITVGNSSTYTEGIHWRDFAILGEATQCNRALYLKKVNRSRFENIHVLCGTDTPGYGVFIEWAVCNYYNFIVSTNVVYPTALTLVAPYIGIVAEGSGGDHEICNANWFNCIIEGPTGSGLTIYTDGINGNNFISGTYEGIAGYAVHIKGGTGAHLFNLHSEAAGDTQNQIVLEGTSWAQLGPGLCSYGTSTTADIILTGNALNTQFVAGVATKVGIVSGSNNSQFSGQFSAVHVDVAATGTTKAVFEALTTF
jgi:hypothetical protein